MANKKQIVKCVAAIVYTAGALYCIYIVKSMAGIDLISQGHAPQLVEDKTGIPCELFPGEWQCDRD